MYEQINEAMLNKEERKQWHTPKHYRDGVLSIMQFKLGSLEAAELWMNTIDVSAGKTPSQMIEEGQGEIVLAGIEDDWSYA